MTDPRSRRAALRACGVAAVTACSGCSAIPGVASTPAQGSFIIENDDDSEHEVSVRATYAGDAADITKTFSATVPGGETETRRSVLTEHGNYEVRVAVRDGPTARTQVEIVTHDGPGEYAIARIDTDGSLSLRTERSD